MSSIFRRCLTFALSLLLCACEGANFAASGHRDGEDTQTQKAQVVEATDSFTARFSQRTDILAVIDNSGSMSQERAAVKSAVAEFHRRINEARTNDYRFAVVTTDAYSNEGALVTYSGVDIVNSQSASAVSLVQGLLDNVVNSPKSYWEQGIKSAERALSVNGSRLLRDDTDLAVIFLSDEEDYSCVDTSGDPKGKVCPGIDVGSEPQNFADPKPWSAVTVDYYKTFFKSLNRSVLMFSIVGTNERKCEEVSKGTRYLALQQGIGTGFTAPICNDQLADNFARIGQAIATRGDCYALSHAPLTLEQSLDVKLDGNSVAYSSASGFSYDSGSHSVCFRGSLIPPAGSSLTVRYDWVK